MSAFPMYTMMAKSTVPPMPSMPPMMPPGAPFPPFGAPMKGMPMMPMPNPGMLQGSVVQGMQSIGQPAKEQLITVYVGRIPAGVEDEFIRKLLEYCGRVSQWRRMSDPKTGKLKAFGFCDYDNPLSVIRALKLLNGVKLMGSELLITVEEKTQKTLEAFNFQRKASIAAVFAVTNANKNDSTPPPDPEDEEMLTIKSLIIANINRREKKQDWKHVDAAIVMEEAKLIRATLSVSSLSSAPSSKEEEKKTETSADQKLQTQVIEPEDKEKKEKQEKLEREREQRRKEREERNYRDREKAWEELEKKRDYDREREKDREKRQLNRAIIDLQYDDSDRRKRTTEYYNRKRFRERELDEDLREKQREKDELEAEDRRRKEKELEMQKALERQQELRDKEKEIRSFVPSPSPSPSPSLPSNFSPSSPVLATSPTALHPLSSSNGPFVPSLKLNVSVAPKKFVMTSMHDDDHEDNDDLFSKRKRKLTTLDEGMIKKQQMDQLTHMISQIPTEKDKLFEYPIDWPAVHQHNLVDSKMKPWVAKKVAEFLGGDEDQSFVQYVLKQINDQVEPQSFLQHITAVLDEDAEGFFVKLWRKLIFEIISVAGNPSTSNST